MINVQGWWQPSQGDVGAARVDGEEDRAVRWGGRGGGSRQLLVFVFCICISCICIIFVFVFVFLFCACWGQELGEIWQSGNQRGEGWVGEKGEYLNYEWKNI